MIFRWHSQNSLCEAKAIYSNLTLPQKFGFHQTSTQPPQHFPPVLQDQERRPAARGGFHCCKCGLMRPGGGWCRGYEQESRAPGRERSARAPSPGMPRSGRALSVVLKRGPAAGQRQPPGWSWSFLWELFASPTRHTIAWIPTKIAPFTNPKQTDKTFCSRMLKLI